MRMRKRSSGTWPGSLKENYTNDTNEECYEH
jgi:hypothetical protein